MSEAFKNAREKTLFCAKAAQGRKAFNICILELIGMTSLTDYFLICSGRSDRQVQAIGQFIQEQMKKEGVYSLGIEGIHEGRWVLMDFGDVIIHIFQDPVRYHFDLEGLWANAPQIPVPETDS
jgi:ribosome-associated protein